MPSWLWRRHREAVVLIAALVAFLGSLAAGGAIGPVDGLIYDAALALNPARPGAGGEPVAVVAVDRDSLGSPELADTPRVFFGPVWAKLLDGLGAAGVRAVGFDIIFSYSPDRFPGTAPHYDAPFYQALARQRGHVVVARSASSPLARPIVAAVTDFATDVGRDEPGAVAYAELIPDADGVQRRVSAALLAADGTALPTLPAAILRQARGPAMPQRLLLAPARPFEAMPTYRLIDVLRCVAHDPAAVRAAFAGKVVLVGSNLAEEDRKRTPDRFMRPARPVAGPAGMAAGCRLDRLGASDATSRTTPGVFVHAAAVSEVLTGDIVRPLPPLARGLAAMVAAAGGAALGFAASPWIAVAAVAGIVALCLALTVALLPLGLWFAAALPAAAAVVAMVLAYLVRFLFEERRRRRVQRAFSHYLAPSVVDRLADSDAELRLGGELREVTVMFADLSGFTALSGRVGPAVLMEVTNAYLGLIVAAVEATGGYVDKFIGDAVMAVWGAPVADPDHAASGARAALAAVAAVMRAKHEADAQGRPGYAVKMGLNTGPAVVGNVGAPQRYNYTAVGETVNIAARLEGVPDEYGCRIVVGPATAAAIAGRFVLCELDWIKVKGKEDAIAIHELIGEKTATAAPGRDDTAGYAAALARYRAGDFAAAATLWHGLADGVDRGTPLKSPARAMALRCATLLAAPPERWDGVFVRTTK